MIEVISLKKVAKFFKCEVRDIRRIYCENFERFQEKDRIVACDDALLFTRRGVMLLAFLLDTPRAWKAFDELIDVSSTKGCSPLPSLFGR